MLSTELLTTKPLAGTVAFGMVTPVPLSVSWAPFPLPVTVLLKVVPPVWALVAVSVKSPPAMTSLFVPVTTELTVPPPTRNNSEVLLVSWPRIDVVPKV